MTKQDLRTIREVSDARILSTWFCINDSVEVLGKFNQESKEYTIMQWNDDKLGWDVLTSFYLDGGSND